MKSLLPDIPRGRKRAVARAALQTAVAAVSAYYVILLVGLDEYFIGILSAVFILTRTIGGTMAAGMQRVIATALGSAIGIASLFLLPDVWGTAVALGLSMLVLGGVANVQPAWTYGMVAAIALSLRAEENAIAVAMDRGLAIAIGAAVGTLVTFVVWPETAHTRFRRKLRSAQGDIARRAAAALDRARGRDGVEETQAADRSYHEDMNAARASAGAVRFDRDKYRDERMEATDRLYHSLTLIDRAVEHGSDDPMSRHADFDDRVEAVRRHAVEVLDILSGDAEGDAQRAFDRLGEDTRRAHEILADDDPRGNAHLRRATLVFGMLELQDALGLLYEELQHDERRSLVGATLREAGAGRISPD